MRDLTVVFVLEELCYHARLALALANLEHGPDQKTDHVVQKPIGCNVEYEPAFSRSPRSTSNGAAMLIPVGGSALDCESPEGVIALDDSCSGPETRKIERFLPGKLVRPAKRGRCEIVCAYVVAVAAGYGAIARVELITHFEGCRNPYIVR
ncbi:MAG: hypothetical protein QOH22_1096 [Gemmatimonadaceae bacterium]|nr:hypothetical protein [Gemmatimonadaceae bacterium]